jgi:hypothetical protein
VTLPDERRPAGNEAREPQRKDGARDPAVTAAGESGEKFPVGGPPIETRLHLADRRPSTASVPGEPRCLTSVRLTRADRRHRVATLCIRMARQATPW